MRFTLALIIFSRVLLDKPQTVLAYGKQFCRRQSSEKSEIPQFLCFYNATVYRRENCSIRVTEDMVFPHTTGDDIYREIPIRFEYGQEILNESLSRAGKRHEAKKYVDEDNNVFNIIMPTKVSSKPVWFQLNYTLNNGILKYANECGTGESDPDRNVIRWWTGKWDMTFDYVSVKFISNDNNVTFEIVGGNGIRGTTVDKTFEGSFESIEVYAKEFGSELCDQSLFCFDEGSSSSSLLFKIISSVTSVIAFVLAIWCLCCCGSCFEGGGGGGGGGGAPGTFGGNGRLYRWERVSSKIAFSNLKLSPVLDRLTAKSKLTFTAAVLHFCALAVKARYRRYGQWTTSLKQTLHTSVSKLTKPQLDALLFEFLKRAELT